MSIQDSMISLKLISPNARDARDDMFNHIQTNSGTNSYFSNHTHGPTHTRDSPIVHIPIMVLIAGTQPPLINIVH